MMDEGNVFLPLKSHTNTSHSEETVVYLTLEESVDEPEESEHIINNDTSEPTSLQSTPENKTPQNTATLTEKPLELLFNSHSDSKVSTKTQGTQTSQEDFASTVEKLNTQQEIIPSENNQGQLQLISNTTKNEEELHLTSKLLVLSNQTETEDGHQDCSQEKNVLQTQNSSQNKPETILQRTISKGNVLAVGQPESKLQPTTKQDQLYPLRNITEDKDYQIVERLSYSQAEDLVVSDKGQPKLQRNAEECISVSYAPKMTELETKGSEIVERLSHSQAKDIVVSDEERPKLQENAKECVTESYMPELTKRDKAEVENDVHHQMPHMISCAETKAAEISKDVTSQSMAIKNDSTQLCPEPLFQGNVHPDQIDTLAATAGDMNTPLSATGIKSPENKMSASTELVQTEPQKEMSPQNDGGSCNTTIVSEEPNAHGNTQNTAEPQQGKDNLALKITDPNGKDVDGNVAQTENDPRDSFPTEVSSEKEQNTKPVVPVYSEPQDFQEHLYVEADDIGLQEDPYIRQQVERLDHVSLNIAVTGMTGAGKSTFINAIRGFNSDDEQAAPTGVTETTMDARPYPHPSMPNVTFWDLPGTGSPKFKAKKYMKDVKFETYDFFIIISSERFKENDIVLAREILKKKRKFYFLRSKIDNDVRSEWHKKNFNEEKLLNHIKEDCIGYLKNIAEPPVFLVSSFDLNKYDFPQLVDTLLKDLPEHKRGILTLSLPIYSTEVLERKIKAFENIARSAAKAAGHISVAPVPGLAIACDAGILLTFFTKCYNAFGLDDKSLDKLSVRVNNPSLKSLRESRPLVMAVRKRELSNRELSALGSKRVALEFAYSLVPVWGSKKAASMACSATLDLLNKGLKELADTARDVLKAAKIDHIK